VGRAYVTRELELPAANARVDPERLADLVEVQLRDAMGSKAPRPRAGFRGDARAVRKGR
jgi:hypothetical protein